MCILSLIISIFSWSRLLLVFWKCYIHCRIRYRMPKFRTHSRLKKTCSIGQWVLASGLKVQVSLLIYVPYLAKTKIFVYHSILSFVMLQLVLYIRYFIYFFSLCLVEVVHSSYILNTYYFGGFFGDKLLPL